MKLVVALICLSVLPFLVMFKGASNASFFLILGSFTGLAGAILLYWQFIIGLRFIASKFSEDTVSFNKLHKFIGLYGMLFVFFHPFIIMVAYAETLAFVFLPDISAGPGLALGRIAFFLLILVWFSSAFFREKLGFRFWKYLHYLTYPIMLFVLSHASLIGSTLATYPILRSFWLLMTVMFIGVMVYRVMKFLGFNKYQYKLVSKSKVGEEVFIYEFSPKEKSFTPKVGQFIYLQINRFGEEHPFTVMEYDDESKKVKLGIKAQGKFTVKLSQIEEGDNVFFDGPYGVFTREGHNESPKILIAGGIGITPFVDLVKRHGDKSTYLFYANRYLDYAVGRELFKKELGSRYIDLISHEEVVEENVHSGILTKELFNKVVPKKVVKSAEYFICGSKGFYDFYKGFLLSLNIPASKIHYEEFGL